MAIRKYDISLDTKVRISNVVIRGRLGDGKGSIVANVTVFNDGQRYNFTGLTPQYEAKLSDGLNIIRDKAGFSAVKAVEGSFTYEFPAELFSAEGYAKASYFTFLDAKGAKQSTFDIAVEVVGMALDGELAETYVSEIDVDLKGLSKEVVTATDAANKAISDIAKNNVQVPKITNDNGAPRYDLNSTKDLFAEILTWGNGFFTFFLSAGATNNPTGTVSWLRGTASTYGKNSNVLAYDKDGAMYTAVRANGIWETWGRQQMYKTTEDDGSSLTLAGYDLLNTTDVSNFDGYVTTAVNAPTTSNAGYFKRKYRNGYIEVSFSPHNANVSYRNAYNFGNKSWYGWEKIIAQSDTNTYQKQKITNDDGTTIVVNDYDLLNTTDVKNLDAYIIGAINMPSGISPSGYVKRKYRGGYIEITYSPYNLNAVYRNSYNSATKVWTGWVQSANQADVTALKGTDTGWVTYNTVNGVLANTSFTDPTENGYKCAYRKITANGVTRLLLRINISNITAESVIFANLPNGIVVNSQSGVARTNKANQKVVVVLRPNGELSINVPAGFSTSAYSYHQFDWTF